MAAFKDKLHANGTVLHPGDDTQLLGFLRAGKCDTEKAAEIAKTFVTLQKKLFPDGMNIFLSTLNNFASAGVPSKWKDDLELLNEVSFIAMKQRL